MDRVKNMHSCVRLHLNSNNVIDSQFVFKEK